MKHFAIVSVAFMLAAGGCGGGTDPTPRQACEEGAAALCARLYACYTAAELQAGGYPATESACVTMTQANDGCAAKTTANICTGGNEVFHGNQVNTCVDQITGLTCAQVRDPNLDVNTAAPACGKVCAIP